MCVHGVSVHVLSFEGKDRYTNACRPGHIYCIQTFSLSSLQLAYSLCLIPVHFVSLTEDLETLGADIFT